jgi:hypothetical protein
MYLNKWYHLTYTMIFYRMKTPMITTRINGLIKRRFITYRSLSPSSFRPSLCIVE